MLNYHMYLYDDDARLFLLFIRASRLKLLLCFDNVNLSIYQPFIASIDAIDTMQT
jgi:hypothetical protein